MNFDAHPDSIPCAPVGIPRREAGVIQCFNWISPLTPLPIGGLTWVPDISDITTTPYDVTNFLKVTGSWLQGGRSRIVSAKELDPGRFGAERVVVSVDLDFFRSRETLQSDMDSVFAFITGLAQADALVIAISRPYQPDNDTASWILYHTLKHLLDSPRFGQIRFEPFLDPFPDASTKARALHAQNLAVPYFDLDKAPAFLRNLLKENAGKITVTENPRRWQEFLRGTGNRE